MSLRIYFIAVFPLALLAQAPTNVPQAAGISFDAAISGGIPRISNSPFSATAITETNQMQPDASSKTLKTISVMARDSKGRTYVENHYPLVPSDTSHGRVQNIIICDPLTRTRTELDPATMQATISSLPASSGPPPSARQMAGNEAEDLGMSTMEGLSVHGQRYSKTITLQPPAIDREPISDGTGPIAVTPESCIPINCK